MGGADSGTEGGGCVSLCERGGIAGCMVPSAPLPPVLGSGLSNATVDVGVVDLLTSTCSFVGDDIDRLISGLLGVVDLVTSGVANVEVVTVVDLLSSEVEVVAGVADLLISDIGERGSVETYLLGSETVERGRVVTL